MPEIPFSPPEVAQKVPPPFVQQEAPKALGSKTEHPPAQVSPELAEYFATMDPEHTKRILAELNNKKSKTPLDTEEDFLNFVESVTGRPIPRGAQPLKGQTPPVPPQKIAEPPLPLEGVKRQLRPGS